MPDLLSGLRILVLEDEFLIAMDVEQICRDHGAAEVAIVRSLAELDDETLWRDADAAVVDLMLGGASTLEFAARLRDRGVPFVFASGYGNSAELARDFPDAAVVTKPYSGHDLVGALAEGYRRARGRTELL